MMKQITIDNYEAYFLDFSEGNLSSDQIVLLNIFLSENPTLAKELHEFENLHLDPNLPPSNNLHASLKREETTSLLDSDYLMIAQIEGTITQEEKIRLSALVKNNPSLLNELAIYHKTRLPKENSIIFENKRRLVRRGRALIVWRSVAAAAILFLVFFNWPLVESKYQFNRLDFTEIVPSVEENTSFAFIAKEDVTAHKHAAALSAKKPTKNLKVRKMQNKEDVVVDQKNELLTNSIALKEELTKSIEQSTIKNLDPEVSSDPEISSIVRTQDSQGEKLGETITSKNKNEFIPLNEFAKNKLRSEIMKGKTFSEIVMEELTDLAKDKLNLETEKDIKGETQKLALNIGKFSFSRNK